MKKIVTTVIALAAAVVVMGQSSDVVVKRGKAVMDESYYYNLKQKADAYDKMEQQNDELQKKLAQTEQTLTQELKKNSVKMTSFNDSASYAIGKDLANNWQQQKLGINLQVVAQSLLDIVHGTNNWSRAQMTPLLRRFQAKFEENERKKREEMMASMETNKKEGTEFLKRNANDKSVKSTKSGLQYKVVKEGNGKRPTAKNRVRVHYTGKLLNGKVFDSSVERGEPMEFGVSEVIAGWTEGLQLMSEGSKYIFYIPSNLGYGDNPIGDIPPGSTLIFEVELLKIIQ